MGKNHWLEIWGFNVKASPAKAARQRDEAALEPDRHLEALLQRLRAGARRQDVRPD